MRSSGKLNYSNELKSISDRIGKNSHKSKQDIKKLCLLSQEVETINSDIAFFEYISISLGIEKDGFRRSIDKLTSYYCAIFPIRFYFDDNNEIEKLSLKIKTVLYRLIVELLESISSLETRSEILIVSKLKDSCFILEVEFDGTETKRLEDSLNTLIKKFKKLNGNIVLKSRSNGIYYQLIFNI